MIPERNHRFRTDPSLDATPDGVPKRPIDVNFLIFQFRAVCRVLLVWLFVCGDKDYARMFDDTVRACGPEW